MRAVMGVGRSLPDMHGPVVGRSRQKTRHRMDAGREQDERHGEREDKADQAACVASSGGADQGHARSRAKIASIGHIVTSTPFSSPGITPLPPGFVAAVVTYLAMDAPPARAPARVPDGVRLERLGAGDLDRYRRLFRSVGEPWLWYSRLRLSDAELAAIIGDDAVLAHAVVAAEADGLHDIGLLELSLRKPEAADLSFFGLAPGRTGQGLGRVLLNVAVDMAFAAGAPRLTVNTCTLDHPAALRTYERAGFRAYARGIEVAEDPRLTGLMPAAAGQGVPLIAAQATR